MKQQQTITDNVFIVRNQNGTFYLIDTSSSPLLCIGQCYDETMNLKNKIKLKTYKDI